MLGLRGSAMDVHVLPGKRFFKKELMARQTGRAEDALETPTVPP